MTPHYAAGLFDRLIDDQPHAAPRGGRAGWTLEQLKDAVARDLEALLNTRAALPAGLLDAYPEVAKSIVNYGLIDFAGMCLTSSEDQKLICAAVQRAIERHEPRLYAVSAALRVREARVNRVDFLISARLKVDAAAELVRFDAVLKPSTQQYAIRQASGADGDAPS
ncbi:type VI secretion system baseplate subunit TssE [Rugamonas sp. CCM 8940]|uniref:type VI secretion system baseplate subunit TssE n=1 Tax=Rugamonas sp. CCM 8940 TaxID=2765359 RepID=UPI0018F6F6AF|nr:type VI secretion system baseplate subunit TssE [Rugamonas sp. CCM 8940]MBJ7312204.1 type VI secretion system baseplate subunit TssE [Rugamonas sp. CCM 8940]